jgi:tRNA pseudouridine13 synthase
LFAASIRQHPSDFVVVESCRIDFSGDGEHDYLWIEKTGANTHWVAECLAKHSGIPVRDVGYAGLKDRHAITRQWFSVHRTSAIDWDEFSATGVVILDQQVHRRKLRRGAHSGNSFKIALRSDAIDTDIEGIVNRVAIIDRCGVPNYFGEQRFGRDGGNIELGRQLFAGRKLSRHRRGIALSAARSLIFNDILSVRVKQETWNTILPGELANLDGTASIFAVEEVDDELVARCNAHDIHASGSLWGVGAPKSTGEVAQLECEVAQSHAEIVTGLIKAKVDASSRPLRLVVRDLQCTVEKDVCWLEFSLPKGGYATTVLREIMDVEP